MSDVAIFVASCLIGMIAGLAFYAGVDRTYRAWARVRLAVDAAQCRNIGKASRFIGGHDKPGEN